MTGVLFQPFPILPGRRAQAWRHQPAFQRPRHFHEEPEINLVTRGTATLGVGDKVVSVCAGHAVFFHPGQDHELLEASADLELFAIALRPELAARACGALSRIASRGCQLSDDELTRMQGALQAMSELSSVSDVERHLSEIFGTVESRSAPTHVLSRIALQKITANPRTSGGDLARSLGTDPSAFSRHFHDDLSLTLVEYRARHRLMAFVNLAHLGKTLSSAAIDAGFGSYAQCHRVFSRTLGCTPRHYFHGRRSEIFNETSGSFRT